MEFQANPSYGLFLLVSLSFAASSCTMAALTPTFYATSCPNVFSVVQSAVKQAVNNEARMAASLLRLHFHDCFVNGCDGSVLLDDSSTFTGEKTAVQNLNSLRGFDVVDNIKAAVEKACPATVSCADILAIAARDSVVLAGGPSWNVLLGRRDSTSASLSAATNSLPLSSDSLSTLSSKFSTVGLSQQDVVVLSGGHTIGKARCITFNNRLYNYSGTGHADPTIDPSYLSTLQRICPQGGDNNVLTSLDPPATPDTFDNNYFLNLQNEKGLLQSDQELYSTSGAASVSYVNLFASQQNLFFTAFSKSMISMGNIKPLTGSQGQIRLNCRVVNS